MTNEKLDALEALANAATPGPWEVHSHREHSATFDWHGVNNASGKEVTGDFLLAEDAAFIAAARTAVPELVAECRRLREMVRLNEEQLEAFGHENELAVERDALRAQVTEWEDSVERLWEILPRNHGDAHIVAIEEITALRTENARLREALQVARDHFCGLCNGPTFQCKRLLRDLDAALTGNGER